MKTAIVNISRQQSLEERKMLLLLELTQTKKNGLKKLSIRTHKLKQQLVKLSQHKRYTSQRNLINSNKPQTQKNQRINQRSAKSSTTTL
jgi:hypothetical protein